MSMLQIIEQAALSLRGDEQRSLLAFLSDVIAQAPQGSEDVSNRGVDEKGPWHADLRPMIGILPRGAEAEEIHAYRLLKHA